MVAITVVLAAILMVMVMGMTGGADTVVSLEKLDDDRIRIASSNIAMASSDVVVKVDGTAVTTGTWSTVGSVLTGSVFTDTDSFAAGATDKTVTLEYQGNVVATLLIPAVV
jgi:hypothetical protein